MPLRRLQWQNVFLGHITEHYLPGGALAWLAVALLLSGAYGAGMTLWLRGRWADVGREIPYFVLNAREIAELSPVMAALPVHRRVREAVKRLQDVGIQAKVAGPEVAFSGGLSPDEIEDSIRNLAD